ncbi:MAG: hypothetical protein MUD16_14870 [Desulfobacterales bacterium]|jgi:hypothetical protein|nr:hypothetical protein [Desulfobacterales bacterium]
MALVLAAPQMFTGILLKFAGEPAPVQANDSLICLQTGLAFGQLIRSRPDQNRLLCHDGPHNPLPRKPPGA